jgi:hypothetical protein
MIFLFRNFYLFFVFFPSEDDYHVAPMSESIDVSYSSDLKALAVLRDFIISKSGWAGVSHFIIV